MTVTRTPRLEEVLRLALDATLGGVHTAMPAIVKSYDASSQKATVQPAVKNIVQPSYGGDDIVESFPVINDVPVIFPHAGGFFISLPVAVGDTVLLVFNERSIDKWNSGDGSEVDPVDMRKHDLSDAAALVGFYPDSKRIGDASSSSLVLGKDHGGMQLSVTPDNKLEAKIGSGVTVIFEQADGAAKMTVGTGALSVTIAEHLQVLWGLLQIWASTHVHNYVAPLTPAPAQPGITTPPIAPAPVWDPAIVSQLAKIPG
jgi:hypothetical protein